MSLIKEARVALITGTSSNLGLNVAYRLFEEVPEEENLTIIVTSRTLPTVNKTISTLKKYAEEKNLRKGSLEFDYILLDLTSMISLLSAVYELKKRYRHIDYLFSTASHGVTLGVNWFSAVYYVLTDFELAFRDGPYRIQEVGVKSNDGMGAVFQGNVFAPYYLIHKLSDLLKGGKVILVSTVLASPASFSFDDFQLLKTSRPYEGSKRLIDMMHAGMYKKFAKQGIQIYLTQPGIFTSYGFREHLNYFTYYGMLAAFMLLRLLYSKCHNISGHIAANALTRCALRDDEPLEMKIGSACHRFGQEFIVRDAIDPTGAEDVIANLDKMVAEWDDKFKDQIVNSRQM